MLIFKCLFFIAVLIFCECIAATEISHGGRNKRFLVYEEGNSRVQVNEMILFYIEKF